MGRIAPMWQIRMGSRACEILNFRGNVQWRYRTRGEAREALQEKLIQSGVTYTIEEEESWFRVLNEFGGEMARVLCG